MDDQDPQRIAEALYVGPVLVEISATSMGSYQAKTANDGVLGVTELGFEIRATAYDNDDAEREPADMVRAVIDRMRHALARCFIFGKMDLMDGGLDEQEWAVVEKVRDALPEGYLEITPALAVEACLRHEERDAAVAEWVETMTDFIEMQQERPGENITLRDAVKRYEERSEEVHKIVEGEEEEK
jgi:hypothetical protein